MSHLRVDLGERVGAVDRDPVGVAAVIARSTRQVAAGKYTMGALAARGASPQQLSGGPDPGGKLLPSRAQCHRQVGIDRASGYINSPPDTRERAGELVDPASERHVCESGSRI